MLQLFFLILFSSCSFSLYLYFVEFIHNPLIFLLLGWGTAVVAYYASQTVDMFNKQYQAFIINGDGEYWTGLRFVEDNGKEYFDEEPAYMFNDSQVEKTLRYVQDVTGCNDLYIRILPRYIDEITPDE